MRQLPPRWVVAPAPDRTAAGTLAEALRLPPALAALLVQRGFGDPEDARAFLGPFFTWYNHEHRHSGIGLLTPAVVHAGRAEQVTAERGLTLARAFQAHPERFVRHPPRPPAMPAAVWINPPKPKEEQTQ